RMNEAVKVVVQIQSNRLRDEAQAENEEYLNNLNENIQKIKKEQVKEQTSYAVAAESDKIILDTYGDTVTLKRRREDANKDKEPSSGSDRGSKRRREGKEAKSTSAPKVKATKTTGKSTERSKSHQKTASESTPAEEPGQTTQDLEEPSHQEFETGDADDQPIVEASQHPKWFQKQKKPPTPDSAWNKTLPATHGSIQTWISDLAKQADSRSSFNELMHTHVDFSAFLMNQLKQFYGFAVNRESARDVYLKRRMIAVIELQIVEWHNYKHLDWITVRRDDDKLYKFKEGNFKRLRIQDTEDMLLLLVQRKLTNLTVEECFAFNVSLIMFTRSIVI
nr:hypothetical protein [Tanacetum cinerariifolium]